ncbi:NAD(P)H-dependent glycerol-3-phosphate dehydrogenase [Salibacterium halotolerans]|uniref:Glycerol-3-phosphate dehydrogenase [NAD(P)+] n=1 Tax=Salibacterium halotolerans TaxID=1884432 RepID=A0A1I5Q592_9BACI|nr:NAD(P)H-dependent glycerol-3-phosphate dehydrogenase [Salibacterium halotolerans]SFP41160.1 glycerol-3-phosphate dehydrogenase (NAD(P)+) [Salibacterium halotolerans]
MADKVAVIGAGSWGTALASVLAGNGQDVRLWTRREDHAEEINHYHTNHNYLPGFQISEAVQAFTDLGSCTRDADYILLVVPAKAVRDMMKELRPFMSEETVLIHASKGIEPGTSKRISEVIEEEQADAAAGSIVVLSGPSHAEEVCAEQPTTVTVSSNDTLAAEKVQGLFMNHYFRVYTNRDIIGVEIGGALKNIIALGIGMTDGLGFGDNAKAAFMTRGLAEISRLGVTLGASPLTFNGLSGLGDLIVTCFSRHSRNRRAGEKIGNGAPLNDVLEEMGMVVEGVRTTKAVYELAKVQSVEMPITEALYEVLFEEVKPEEAVRQLMARERKHEEENMSLLLDPDFQEKWNASRNNPGTDRQ